MNFLNQFFPKFITDRRGKPGISKIREVSATPNREINSEYSENSDGQIIRKSDISDNQKLRCSESSEFSGKLVIDSLLCPYCASRNFVKRGFRQKKLERVQLLLCGDCHKTFTPNITKGKHYPLATIFDAVSLYNLGYSLEESCRRVNKTIDDKKKNETIDGSAIEGSSGKWKIEDRKNLSSTFNPQPLSSIINHLSSSTLSNWLSEFKEMMPFERMRDFMMYKYKPQDAVVTATLAHQQLYRYRFHRAKCQAVMQEHFHHSFFKPLKEFLELVPSECPHQFFSQGLRASDAPLTFSKTAMIVRGKQNFATRVAAFVLQSVKERKARHEAVQKFMLYNDSVTVATEVPVYLTRDDLEHMKTQLGFEIYDKKTIDDRKLKIGVENGRSKIENANPSSTLNPQPLSSIVNLLPSSNLPKLITGHIDILQIRNGLIHLLDFKPNAEKERPIEQLTLYAMALSRLTGLRLFEFKCAWFDEKDYFEFYPLHVLHKPKKARRRRKIETMEGVYNVNKDENRISQIRPVTILTVDDRA